MTRKFRRRKITQDKTLGERLAFARKRQAISLEEAEEKTKIRLKYLEALEKDQYSKIPSAYVLGYLSRYGEFLGLGGEKVALELRKGWGGKPDFRGLSSVIGPKRDIKARGPIITPRTILIILVSLAVIGLLGYIGIQVKKFSTPPELEIFKPSDQTVTATSPIKLEGKTFPLAQVIVNGELVVVDEEGGFAENIELVKGLNTIEVISRNRAGKETKKTIKVLYEVKENQ